MFNLKCKLVVLLRNQTSIVKITGSIFLKSLFLLLIKYKKYMEEPEIEKKVKIL